jgi:virginiamycin B lyase
MRRLSLLLALGVLLGLLTGGQDRAAAALYWAHSASLGRANLDGSQPFWPLPNGWSPALEAHGACGLAVDDQHLYWGDASGGAIGRATIDGTAPNQAFVSGLGAPCGVAVTGTHIYWSDFDTNMIGRANLDGSGVEPAFISGAAGPCGVAVSGGHIFWTNQDRGSIGRANLDGSEVDHEFIAGLGAPCGVAVDASRVYWGDQESESIGRAELAGGGIEPAFVGDAGEPWDVDVNGSHVFWAERRDRPRNPYGGIDRATLDGAQVQYDLVPAAAFPTGVALDGRTFGTAAPPPRPSDYLRFGKLTRDRATGALQLIVYVPARGEFRVDSPAIGWSIDKGNPPPWLAGSFRWKLRLWPGKGTKAAKRIHRQLRRAGRAPVVLRTTYQQEGRLPLKGVKRLAFQRQRPAT